MTRLDASALRPLPASAGELAFFCDLAAVLGTAEAVDALPYTIRILVENVCRSRLLGAARVSERDVAAVLGWRRGCRDGVPLAVSRVVLPDSSGLPVLLDLAALRDAVARGGGDPRRVDPTIPVDLIVDHSLHVDHAGVADAMVRNVAREFERNAERYIFLKWARQAFSTLRLFPPGSGIIHQINLEHLASIVAVRDTPQGRVAFPEFVLGGDSHTPMVNALGILAWGVGGIDAELALLGEPYVFPLPEVVGVRLAGRLPAGAMTTDLALTVTERLRKAGVVAAMVEFFGPGAAALSIPERATIANMAPEYGATVGLFPVDRRTLAYLAETGRPAAQVALVDAYCRANRLFRDEASPDPDYPRVVEIDLGGVETSLAGPRRPQDRLGLSDVAADFRARLTRPLADDGFGAASVAAPSAAATPESAGAHPTHGSIVIAAITSCTNTSNPGVMLAAGLVARKATAAGLRPPPWVKTSLAPGSRVVARYLAETGLLADLEALGFHLVGFGCTTCGGKSGPLAPEVAAAIEERGLVTAAVLSGNRNFEGRIHRLVRANYIGAPPLVVAYALAGRIDIDLAREPIGVANDGKAMFLRDLWPAQEEIDRLLPSAARPDLFEEVYGDGDQGPEEWRDLAAPSGDRFAWDEASTYLVEPPFFADAARGGDVALPERIAGARALAAFGDSITTDHILPGGEIPPESPAGRYLSAAGVARRDFNSYVTRRCNHHVMARATFASLRIRNLLLPGNEGGFTRHWPDGGKMTIFDAAAAYRDEGTPMIVLAGKEYGTGSSRDWAAKGAALLGVRAVIAESFERIHRANLVALGIPPLLFRPGEGWRQLGLSGAEAFTIAGLRTGIADGSPIEITARAGASARRFTVTAQAATEAERTLLLQGGPFAAVLKRFLATDGGAGEAARQ